MIRAFAILLLVPVAALADVVVPARTIRPDTVIGAADVLLKSATIAGAHSRLEDVIGQEARVALYPGRPVRRGDVGPPALVERNAIVPLVYRRSGLEILTEGRALGRGASGERIKVMNLSSRGTVMGRIHADGSIHVD
ncbi:MAG: flagellar basal body P-ring formation chaperone FlgA [Rhodobacteraceae bacterium]|nr:flagellar basal body P-ring formation chaperone FlgA [Paracoccaceae bacterium]